MNLKSFSIIPAIFLSFFSLQLAAGNCFEGDCGDSKVCGKLDLGGAYIHLDMLEDGKTVDRLDMPAIKADACWAFWKGLSIKPMIMWGKNEKELFTTGIGLGHITPIGKCFYLTPVVGINYSYFKTDFSIPQLQLFNLDQKLTSWAPYVAMEFTWNITKQWRTSGLVQYSWTRNHSTIKNLSSLTGGLVDGSLTEWSRGWSYGLQLERDINKCWSVNAGGAYNTSLSKEKRGLRAYGFKIGLVRWF